MLNWLGSQKTFLRNKIGELKQTKCLKCAPWVVLTFRGEILALSKNIKTLLIEHDNTFYILERLHDTDDNPSCHFSSDKSCSDLKEDFRGFQKCQKIFHFLSINFTDKSTDLFEGSVVDESDDFADRRYEFGDQQRFVRIPKIS